MYANLKGEMSKKNIQQTSIAQRLGLHENTVNNKLNGKSRFTVEEAFLIKAIFFKDDNIDLGYLFKSEELPPDQAS